MVHLCICGQTSTFDTTLYETGKALSALQMSFYVLSQGEGQIARKMHIQNHVDKRWRELFYFKCKVFFMMKILVNIE